MTTLAAICAGIAVSCVLTGLAAGIIGAFLLLGWAQRRWSFDPWRIGR